MPRFRAHLAVAAIVLIAAIWLSTGTMAPYAATVESPSIAEPCHYLVSVDHEQFVAPFRMMRGDPVETWGWSVVLRRLLFPIIALPFVNVFGFLTGGLIASMLVNVAAVIAFTMLIRRRFGEAAALTALWLLATYPGITYWAGLPYSYVVIVPGSLACMMLLYRLQDANTLRDAVAASLLLGIVFLGYDLLPFFGAAAALLLLLRRRFLWMVAACVTMLLPSFAVAALFILIGVPLVNANTVMYLVIINAYAHPDFALWARYIAALPRVFLSNFLFSNFVVLPLLFCGATIVALRRKFSIVERPEIVLMIASLAVFLFNNAAPPYYGWQLRGDWVARLYQPVLPALLLAIARVSQRSVADRRWQIAIAVSVLANASIAFGPVLMNPISAHVYQRFYMHSSPDSLLVNLRRFGRRPLGVCSTNHEWDHIPNPNTPFNRPAYQFRYLPQ